MREAPELQSVFEAADVAPGDVAVSCRDLKPENVFLSALTDPGRPTSTQAILGDYGLALFLRPGQLASGIAGQTLLRVSNFSFSFLSNTNFFFLRFLKFILLLFFDICLYDKNMCSSFIIAK